ncbi:hypothetical protein SDRG_15642 [Saprolegnia diclina VS20]|uniref:BZIP domain-containing protein n=1 Tax=Saprolegnia diclina (strain VS20) TaxID=1156394 RepID=T0PZN3_SAPDV|nr:hypothetical protein SDRG_15642 [Saprolegnia diclina VS20]EQC26550.1 hypothetical protein SDRG_15642 [Saprolegnia diclina VS20]|eukprot:XP_008620043.1 hypothetical protein SDRG_15642 [Saprolegnia diclina VS20]
MAILNESHARQRQASLQHLHHHSSNSTAPMHPQLFLHAQMLPPPALSASTSLSSLPPTEAKGSNKQHISPKCPKDTKKAKVSRERQLKINAASRKCRRKQKVELHFLRAHVVDLRKAMADHGKACASLDTSLLDRTESTIEELTSVRVVKDDPNSSDDERGNMTDEPSPFADGRTHQELTTIGSYILMNVNLESKSFSPDSISCLPIHMDGWMIRLSITERSYAFYNEKFFPCNTRDLFDFIWEASLQETTPDAQSADLCKVTSLTPDMAFVVSKTIGRWSLQVHGVPNVSYNSIVARTSDGERHMVCQQSVLGPSDFSDPSVEPWLFKRWVVFRPVVQDGVVGTLVEAYRSASYASGRRLYSETNTYDSFCEHIIRRYAESNAVLDRKMAMDVRFAHLPLNENTMFMYDTMSERMVKDFLLL